MYHKNRFHIYQDMLALVMIVALKTNWFLIGCVMANVISKLQHFMVWPLLLLYFHFKAKKKSVWRLVKMLSCIPQKTVIQWHFRKWSWIYNWNYKSNGLNLLYLAKYLYAYPLAAADVERCWILVQYLSESWLFVLSCPFIYTITLNYCNQMGEKRSNHVLRVQFQP